MNIKLEIEKLRAEVIRKKGSDFLLIVEKSMISVKSDEIKLQILKSLMK